MKISLFGKCSAVILLAMGLWIAAPAAWGQAGTYAELNSKGQKAESLPTSDRTILFEVTMPSGKLVKVRIKEGGMAKVGDLDQGYAYAFVPVIKDMYKHTATFTVFQLAQDKQGNESVQQLEHIDVDAAAPIATSSQPKLQLRVISTDEPKLGLFAGKPDWSQPFSKQAFSDGKKDCCLRCGGTWACAICVIMDCGCCCDPGYKCQP